MEHEDGGFPGGPYDFSLLLDFGRHVACKLWSDKVVSIIALFNLMICYCLFYVLFFLTVFVRIRDIYFLLRIFHVYFTYYFF
jgi:hypothetical protein